MTLIAAILSHETGECCHFSDVAWTRDGIGTESISLPIRRRFDDENAKFAFSTVRRKSFRPHPDILLQVAGPLLPAYALAKLIRANVSAILEAGSGFSLTQLVDVAFAGSRTDDSSFILSIGRVGSDGNKRFSLEAFNCETYSDRAKTVFFAGTGGVYVNDSFGPEVTGLVGIQLANLGIAVGLAIDLLLKCLTAEVFEDEFDYFRFGGWYELVSASSKGFIPVTFTLNFFKGFDGSFLDYYDRMFPLYTEFGLHVCTIAIGPFLKGSLESLQHWPVPDLVDLNSTPVLHRYSGTEGIGGKSDIFLNIVQDWEKHGSVKILVTNYDVFEETDLRDGDLVAFRVNRENMTRVVDALCE